MISDLWNCSKTVTRSIVFPFFEILLEKISERFNVFIISKRQSSLSNKFYDRNQTLQVEAISSIVRIDWTDWLVLYQFFVVINLRLNVIVASVCSTECSLLLSVLPVADSFSNKEMRTFNRIRAHQSTSETINKSLWRRKTKPASFNDFGVMILVTNKICGALRDEFLSFLFCGTSCFKNNFSFFNQYKGVRKGGCWD